MAHARTTDAAFLRDVGEFLSLNAQIDLNPEEIRIAGASKDRLTKIAAKLERIAAVGPLGLVSQLIGQLALGVTDQAGGVFLNRQDCELYHAALLAEGSETADRMTLAGLEAARQARFAQQLLEIVRELLDEATLREEHPLVTFTFSPLPDTGEPGSMGVELGMELALVLSGKEVAA